MPVEKIVRSFFPNGQVQTEATLVDGKVNGVTRHWHPNGVLAKEFSVKHGVLDGVSRCWDDRGELLGTYEMKDGTGISRDWAANGILVSEITHVNNEFTGRQRAWFEDGEFVGSLFWIRGRKVSRKRYFEACKTDPSLPRYEDEREEKGLNDQIEHVRPQRKVASSPQAVNAASQAFQDYLSDPTKTEARSWLLTAGASKTRTLGELPNTKESLALIEEGYGDGVLELFVVKVAADDVGFENTGTLLARLPTTGPQRQTALAWCNEQNGFQGFDPDDDEGQEWVLVQLD